MALTSDLWTSRANEACITITSHFLNESHQLNSYVLDTISFDAAHTGDNLSTYFKAALSKWNIEDKVDTIVTDNASNITNGVEYSGRYSLKCTAHTLNLAAKDILEGNEKIDALLNKCRKIVGHFKRSSKAQQKLISIQERLDIKKHKMIQEVRFIKNRICYQIYFSILF